VPEGKVREVVAPLPWVVLALVVRVIEARMKVGEVEEKEVMEMTHKGVRNTARVGVRESLRAG
jgi:hypothetical protein